LEWTKIHVIEEELPRLQDILEKQPDDLWMMAARISAADPEEFTNFLKAAELASKRFRKIRRRHK
jgi:hypothetical protein